VALRVPAVVPEPPPSVPPRGRGPTSRPPQPPVADADQPVSSGTLEIRQGNLNDLAVVGALKTHRARLVIANDAIRRVDPIRVAEFTVGREAGDCVLGHPGVSQPHAKIRFVLDTNGFQIEDLGSRNQTFCGSLALSPHVWQGLQPETHLRLGPIDALFVVSLDSEKMALPPQRYENALSALVETGQVTEEQARAARAEAAKGEQHVGEVLLLRGIVGARAWAKAWESATAQPPPPKPRSKSWVWLLVCALLLAALAAAWMFRARLGLGGP
jgi:hypothetical protein